MTKSRNTLAPKRPWALEEESVLRDLYPDLPCADIAALLDRMPGSVYQAAARLGLRKSEHFHSSDLSGRIHRGKQHPKMVATQFQKGLTPWNKGTHYLAGGRSAETRFKKGCMGGAAQHNYKPIGSLRISKDGYLEKKVNDTHPTPARRWVAVHRLVWESVRGPIPKGHIVVFKQGCKTIDLDLLSADRLECISRAENASRNHPITKSPELAKLVQLKGAITRQLNRLKRESETV